MSLLLRHCCATWRSSRRDAASSRLDRNAHVAHPDRLPLLIRSLKKCLLSEKNSRKPAIEPLATLRALTPSASFPLVRSRRPLSPLAHPIAPSHPHVSFKEVVP